MKTKFLLIIVLLLSGIVIGSCNHKKQYRPDKAIIQAVKTKYPEAKKIEWEQKQGYYVAEFNNNNTEYEAWFDKNGNWVMTESNIKYNNLPQNIRYEFEKSSYSDWKKEDIDKIERPDMKTVYILEVEKEDQDIDLYYTEDGMLMKTFMDEQKDGQISYMPIPATIMNTIRQKYPQATIIKTELDKGKYEIDILDNGDPKEMIFNGTTWEATYWEVVKSEIPNAVMEAFRNSAYNKYRIDEIHFFETPTNSYYHFELEQSGTDAYLSIDPQGNVIN